MATMASPDSDFMSALAESGEYTDLTITCGINSYAVHRALVCTRSDFFRRAVNGHFQEARTGVVDLKGDNPEIVDHMIKYFYHSDYLPQKSARRLSRSSTRRSSIHRNQKLNLALVEDPFVAISAALSPLTPPEEPSARRDASHPSTSKIPDDVDSESDEEDALVTVQNEINTDPETSHLLTHARVYAIAEKYGIAGLKSLARQKFSDQLQIELRNDSKVLPLAFEEVYGSTVVTDRGLRDVVVQAFRSHPDLQLRKDIVIELQESPGLAFDLLRALCGLPSPS